VIKTPCIGKHDQKTVKKFYTLDIYFNIHAISLYLNGFKEFNQGTNSIFVLKHQKLQKITVKKFYNYGRRI